MSIQQDPQIRARRRGRRWPWRVGPARRPPLAARGLPEPARGRARPHMFRAPGRALDLSDDQKTPDQGHPEDARRRDRGADHGPAGRAPGAPRRGPRAAVDEAGDPAPAHADSARSTPTARSLREDPRGGLADPDRRPAATKIDAVPGADAGIAATPPSSPSTSSCEETTDHRGSAPGGGPPRRRARRRRGSPDEASLVDRARRRETRTRSRRSCAIGGAPALAAARRITGDAALAEDAAQEAFLRAFRALGRLPPESSFRAPGFARSPSAARSTLMRRRRPEAPLPRAGRTSGG